MQILPVVLSLHSRVLFNLCSEEPEISLGFSRMGVLFFCFMVQLCMKIIMEFQGSVLLMNVAFLDALITSISHLSFVNSIYVFIGSCVFVNAICLLFQKSRSGMCASGTQGESMS